MTDNTAYDERTLPLWSDNPATEDLLGFVDVARPIAAAIKRERLNPVSVGLIGPWGSGKTTILNLIAEELEADKRVIVVRTSPWEYDPNVDIKATIIGEVLDRIRQEAEPDTEAGRAVLGIVKGLAAKVRWSKAVALAAKTAVTLQVPDFDALQNVFNLDDDGGTSPDKDPTLSGFREEFRKALTALDEVDRVVVLVDDLDRCLGDAVIAILEAIKLFLSVDKMAFVIAYDQGPVVEAIRERYEHATNPDGMAKQYLEKIIQVPVQVPRLNQDEVRTYLAVILLEQDLDPEEIRRIVANASERRAKGSAPLLDGHGVALRGNAASAVALASRLAPVVAADLEGNPRRLKRFLNDYWMRSAMAKARSVDLPPDAVAKLIVLEQLHDAQFREVVGWAAQGVVGDRVRAIEDGNLASLENWGTDELKAWAALEPKLADLPLGPYLELAASLRSIRFSAVGLPPELQEILGRLTDRSDAVRKAGQKAAKALDGEKRVLLGVALVELLPRATGRQGELAESIPDIVNGSDSVARALVDAVKELDPPTIEPVVMLRLANLDQPSTNEFIALARKDARYETAVAALTVPKGA